MSTETDCQLRIVFFQILGTAFIALVLIICGAVFWARGNGFNENTFFIVSLPLTPSYENPLNTYIVSNNTNQSLYYNNSFAINIPAADTSSMYSFYIIHNMFGYDMNMTVSGAGQSNFVLSQNTDPDNLSSVEYNFFDKQNISFNNVKVTDDYFRVWCPSSSPITQYYGVDKNCATGAYPIKMDGKYALMRLGSGRMSVVSNMIDFFNTTFIPNNYIDIPQAYLAGAYAESQSSLGRSLTIAGIVIFVAMIIEIAIVLLYLAFC